MGKPVNNRVMLRRRPEGLPKKTDFEWRTEGVPRPGDGQVLLRNIYLSLDPAIRGWMSPAENSYQPPIEIGEVMRGVTVGRVEETNNANFAVGDYVMGLNGWEQYSISNGQGFISKIPPHLDLPLSNFLGVLGTTGLTAYFGLLEIGGPKKGETVLVSAAAGAVGSIVGQIAQIKGCKTVGIAGGKEKCERLKTVFGFDETIDYKASGSIEEKIRSSCPAGIDIYFDNVGGEILDGALNCLADGARVVMCGAISTYNDETPTTGPSNLWQLLVHNARMEGFIVSKFVSEFPNAISQLGRWVSEGRLQHCEEFVDGLENAPDAFLRLFDGSHSGKLIVNLGRL